MELRGLRCGVENDMLRDDPETRFFGDGLSPRCVHARK
jgi:hypothetical protein